MSELSRFRDYARGMADMTEPVTAAEPVFNETGRVIGNTIIVVTPLPTPAERQVWTQLADEIDVYLTGDSVDVDLFGHLTVVPNLPDEETSHE